MASMYALPSVTVEATTSFKVFTPSGDVLTPQERACILSSYLSAMHGQFQSQEHAIAFTSNLLCMAQGSLANELVKAKSVKVTNTPVPKSTYLQMMGVDDKPEGFKSVDGFPSFLRTPTDKASANSNVKNAYAGAAMVLFSIGKEFNTDNEKGAVDNRPKALRGQYGIAEEDFVSSPGKEDGPTVASLGQVFTAYNVYTEIRSLTIKVFLSIYRSGSHQTPEMGLLMTSMQLLDGAQMTHVSTIQDMLQAHPWLVKVPSLRPSIKEYIEELKRFAQVPPSVRGYIRLVETNQNLYFPSSKMRPLVAVAVSLKSEIEESMVKYAGGKGQYVELVAEVKRFQDGFRMQEGVDNLATALDVPDVTLPTILESVVLTPAPTV